MIIELLALFLVEVSYTLIDSSDGGTCGSHTLSPSPSTPDWRHIDTDGSSHHSPTSSMLHSRDAYISPLGTDHSRPDCRVAEIEGTPEADTPSHSSMQDITFETDWDDKLFVNDYQCIAASLDLEQVVQDVIRDDNRQNDPKRQHKSDADGENSSDSINQEGSLFQLRSLVASPSSATDTMSACCSCLPNVIPNDRANIQPVLGVHQIPFQSGDYHIGITQDGPHAPPSPSSATNTMSASCSCLANVIPNDRANMQTVLGVHQFPFESGDYNIGITQQDGPHAPPDASTTSEADRVDSFYENDHQCILAALDRERIAQDAILDLPLPKLTNPQPTEDRNNKKIVENFIYPDVFPLPNITFPDIAQASTSSSVRVDDEWAPSCSCSSCVDLFKAISDTEAAFSLDPVPISVYPARFIPDLRKKPLTPHSVSHFLPRPNKLFNNSVFLEAQVHLCSQGVYFHPMLNNESLPNVLQRAPEKNSWKSFNTESNTLRLYFKESLLQAGNNDVSVSCPICSSRWPSLPELSTICTNPAEHRRKHRILFMFHRRLFIKGGVCVCGLRMPKPLSPNKFWIHLVSHGHMLRLWALIQHYIATGNIILELLTQTTCSVAVCSPIHNQDVRWQHLLYELGFGYHELLQSVYDSAPPEFWFAFHCLNDTYTTSIQHSKSTNHDYHERNDYNRHYNQFFF